MYTSQISIMIVDDDADYPVLFTEGLRNVLSNYQVTRTQNGAECLRYLKVSSAPDIIFMHLNMPVKGGLEALREIQDQQLAEDTPIIIYSTSNQLKDIEACSKCGARFYIIKPQDYTALSRLLERVVFMLGRSKQEQQAKENFVIRYNNQNAA